LEETLASPFSKQDSRWAISPACRTLGIVLAAAALLATISPAAARIVKNDDGEDPADPRLVFGQIARAWEDMDERALADLVHDDGLSVSTGSSGERRTHYSPSQAYYYFKNIFHSHRTLLFEFRKVQDASAGDRVHGMADWKRRRPDSEQVQELKLVCVLARQGDRWLLVEINKIR
jgi:hypothetical protein